MTSNLKAKRNEAQLSQVELAVRSGIQPGLLCRYEKGVAPCQRNALRLARALGCVVEEVFPDYRFLRPY